MVISESLVVYLLEKEDPMKFLLLFMISLGAYAQETWNKETIEEGKRLLKVMGCNDCHTPMYGEKNGDVPEKDWLTGSDVGFKGPWGTSYPSNLRILVQSFKEPSFIKYVRNRKYLPPMPGYNIKDMTDEELGAMFAYLKTAGPAGKKAPENLKPNEKPKTPFIYFVPVKE